MINTVIRLSYCSLRSYALVVDRAVCSVSVRAVSAASKLTQVFYLLYLNIGQGKCKVITVEMLKNQANAPERHRVVA
jgi:hypothetical protein